MVRRLSLATLFVMLASLLFAMPTAQAAPVGLRVSGTRVVEANGSTFVMRGVNHPHVWFPSQTSSFANIKATGANTVRVVLGTGKRWGPSSANDVANVISRCKQTRMICVLEVHDTTGYGDEGTAATLDQAASYWISIANVLKGQENYVVINLGNEPLGNNQQVSSNWASWTSNAVKRLRSAGLHHLVMVDGPMWGQDWQNIMRNTAGSVENADPDHNVLFSIHMYSVYNTAEKVSAYFDAFRSANLPLVVGEFGGSQSGTAADAIMQQAQTRGLGYIGWSWSGNGGGNENLDMTYNFNPNSLTPWGQRFLNGANGIRQTSHEATIYRAATTTVPTSAAATRIMPLGDSITGSPGCWRALLSKHLRDTGHTNIDFVGTLPAPGCGFAYDGENEGHGGYLATNIARNNQLPGWLSATRPDIVLMHLGTNDVWNNIPAGTILNAYTTLLNQMRASNPRMKLVVARILPMNPSGCSACGQRVVALNNAIPGWAQSHSTATSPITVVDQWSGFNTATDTYDGVHPNSTTGIQKMESRWYPAVVAALAATMPATPGLHVEGTRVVEANGATFVMRGVNHAHVWYANQTSSFANIKATGANTVRVVLGMGKRWGPNSASDVANVISLCKGNRLICVLEVADTTGYGEEPAAATLDQAASYWVGLAGVLKGQENYIAINLGNEPFGNNQQVSATWASATSQAIARLRNAGLQHLLMADGPMWGQDWQNIMRSNAASVLNADPLHNTVFSIHMYGVYDTAAEINAYFDAFKTAGLPLVVGEFGINHTDGNPDEDTIMAQAQARGLGYLGWSWSGNSGDVAYLDMVYSFNPNSLTPWGQRIINGANGIRQTSKQATIYG